MGGEPCGGAPIAMVWIHKHTTGGDIFERKEFSRLEESIRESESESEFVIVLQYGIFAARLAFPRATTNRTF